MTSPWALPLAVALGASAVVAGGATAAELEAGAIAYTLLPDSSTVHIRTGSSGFLGFAGHEHMIAIRRFTGDVRVDTTDVSRFALAVTVPAPELRVIDPDQDEETRAKVEKEMQAKVLESTQFPTFTLHGVRFAPETPAAAFGTHTGELVIGLTLHGVSRAIGVPVTLTIDREWLRARGTFAIKHSEFGLTRIKVAGLVNVAEKISITFDVMGRSASAAAGATGS